MEHAQLPEVLWPYALLTAVGYYNYSISSATDNIPIRRFLGRRMKLPRFKVFGCLVVATVPDTFRDGISSNGIEGAYLGPALRSKGSIVFAKDTGEIFESALVQFFEDRVFFKENPWQSDQIPTRSSHTVHSSIKPLYRSTVPTDLVKSSSSYRRLPIRRHLSEGVPYNYSSIFTDLPSTVQSQDSENRDEDLFNPSSIAGQVEILDNHGSESPHLDGDIDIETEREHIISSTPEHHTRIALSSSTSGDFNHEAIQLNSTSKGKYTPLGDQPPQIHEDRDFNADNGNIDDSIASRVKRRHRKSSKGWVCNCILSKRYSSAPDRCITHDGLADYWQQPTFLRRMCRERYNCYDSSNFVDQILHAECQLLADNEPAIELSSLDAQAQCMLSHLSRDLNSLYSVNSVIQLMLPANFQQVLDLQDKKRWLEACKQELNSLMSYQTFEICSLPHGRKPLACRWVFTIKSDDVYKARLVVKGFSEKYGIDYKATFAPVIRYESVRLLLAIGATINSEVHQMDVKTAFLNGDLEEEIYMQQPPGFPLSSDPGKVLRLRKSLYGLKQAPRAWNIKFNEVSRSLGLTRCLSEPCIYTQNSGGDITLLGLYVDDILIVGTSSSKIGTLKKQLMAKFDIRDLGLASKFLGMNIYQDDKRIKIDLKDYWKKVFSEIKLEEFAPDCAPLKTSNDRNRKPKKDFVLKNIPYKKLDLYDITNSEPGNEFEFRSLIGKLLFAANSVRPDLSFRISQLAQFLNSPTKNHLLAVKHVLKYVEGTLDMGLTYYKKSGPSIIEGYSDSDWANHRSTSKSTTGNLFVINNTPLIWKSKLQTSVAVSVAEAEIFALSEAGKLAMWLRNMIAESTGSKIRINIGCDNNAAIASTEPGSHHDKMKHIRIRLHFIQDEIEKKSFEVTKIHTLENLADLFTKMFHRPKFESFLRNLNMIPSNEVVSVKGEC